MRTHAATVPDLAAAMLPGPYRVPAYRAIPIDLPESAREGAQVYLLSSYDPRIRGRVEYPPEIAAVTG